MNIKKSLQQIKYVKNILQLPITHGTVWKTSKGFHVKLFLQQKIPDIEIVFLQAAMGSDFKRECFNYKRIKNNTSKNWNVLFREKQDINGKVLSREKYYCSLRYKAKD